MSQARRFPPGSWKTLGRYETNMGVSFERVSTRFFATRFFQIARTWWEIGGGKKKHHAFSNGVFFGCLLRTWWEFGGDKKTPRIFRWSFFRCSRGRGGLGRTSGQAQRQFQAWGLDSRERELARGHASQGSGDQGPPAGDRSRLKVGQVDRNEPGAKIPAGVLENARGGGSHHELMGKS
jgi:hypothetical protein